MQVYLLQQWSQTHKQFLEHAVYVKIEAADVAGRQLEALSPPGDYAVITTLELVE